MAPVTPLSASVNQHLVDALTATLPGTVGDALLRRSDRADFQANGILALAKKAKANPGNWRRRSSATSSPVT